MTDDPRPARYERPLFLLGVALGLATLVGLLFATQSVVSAVADERTPNVAWALKSQLSVWYAWVLLVPGLWWWFGRLGFQDRGLPGALALHLPTGLAASVVHITVVTAIWSLMGVLRADPGEIFRRLLVNQTFTSYNTYGLIAVSYHMLAYLRRLDREQAAVRVRDEQLSRARLRALQNQIHPHFLFNALNTVSSSLRNGDPERGARILSVLGDLLRHVLTRTRDAETTVADELDFLDLYFELLRSRFGDRIAFDRVVDPGALGASVPTLVLQPLVENAVRHGTARTPGPGRIVVRVVRSGDRLLLEVEDDGPGPPADAREGFGLAGTRERVRELYGPEADLELVARASGGTVVLVDLPFRAGGNGANRPAVGVGT